MSRLQQLELTPDDIGERVQVMITITPQVPQDTMMQSQVVQSLSVPDATGTPMVDRKTMTEMFPALFGQSPELIRQRLDEQMLPQKSEEIAKIQLAASENKWKENNPETVEAAETDEETLTLTREQLKEMISLTQMAQQDPRVAQALGGQPPVEQQQQALPGGADPRALPSQFSMTAEDEVADVPQVIQQNAARAFRG
jgi:hypothetical protein